MLQAWRSRRPDDLVGVRVHLTAQGFALVHGILVKLLIKYEEGSEPLVADLVQEYH